MAPHSIDHIIQSPNKVSTPPAAESQALCAIRTYSFADLSAAAKVNTKVVIPEPGFCAKIFNVYKYKFFLNVCGLPELPSPNVSLDELMESMLLYDLEAVRIPISISTLRVATDASNNNILVCDAAINSGFLMECNKRYALQMLIVVIFSDYVQQIYHINLDPMNVIILKRQFYGFIAKQLLCDEAINKVKMELYDKLAKMIYNELNILYTQIQMDPLTNLNIQFTMEKNFFRSESYRIRLDFSLKEHQEMSTEQEMTKLVLLKRENDEFTLDSVTEYDEFWPFPNGGFSADANLYQAVNAVHSLCKHMHLYLDPSDDEATFEGL